MNELEFKYEGILNEENLQLSDLPIGIRKSINALKPNYARFQKSPSDAMRKSLIQMDIDVSNQILNWLEEEAEDEAEEARLAAEAEAKAKAEQEAVALAAAEAAKAEEIRLATEAQSKADEEARLAEEARVKAEQEAEEARLKAEEEAAAKLKEEEEAAAKAAEEAAQKAKSYKFGTPEMLSAIKEKIDSNGGHILISELKSIIKKEPSYPYQEVCDVKLHKPYMKSYYVIV